MTQPSEKDKCTPEYWFVKSTDKFNYPRLNLAFPDGQLLSGRIQDWRKTLPFGMSTAQDVLLSDYTSDNNVTPLIDGEAYMKDLYTSLVQTGPNDIVCIAGWQFTKDQVLVRDENQKISDTALDVVLKKLLTEKNYQVPVYLLTFALPRIIPNDNAALVDLINGLTAGKADMGGAYLDPETGGFASSHHQKLVFLQYTDVEKEKRHSIAYVGGMDLASSRWDTPRHNKTKLVSLTGQYAWHDVQCRVEGGAATQLYACFADRWNSHNKRLQQNLQSMLPKLLVPQWPSTNVGTHHVQVLRTVAPAGSSNPKRYMKDGEKTVLQGLAKAISLAEHYIYIEDQFLWDGDIAELIAAQMFRKVNLRVICVISQEAELPGTMKMYQYYLRSEFLRKLTRVRQSEFEFGERSGVYPYYLRQTPETRLFPKPIYVHSKLIIIDDRYVALGSANVNQRSMHVDTELALGIVDEDLLARSLEENGPRVAVSKFATELREALWKEHLGLSRDTLPSMDPIRALKTCWPRADGETWPASEQVALKLRKHHVCCYINKPGAKLATATRNMIDRETRTFRGK